MINYLLALQSLVRVSDWLIDVFIVFVLMYCANQNKIMLLLTRCTSLQYITNNIVRLFDDKKSINLSYLCFQHGVVKDWNDMERIWQVDGYKL